MAILSIIGAAYFWTQRARNARDMLGDVGDMANDVRLAARRFGFTRKMNYILLRALKTRGLPLLLLPMRSLNSMFYPPQHNASCCRFDYDQNCALMRRSRRNGSVGPLVHV